MNMPTFSSVALVSHAEILCDRGLFLQARAMLPQLDASATVPASLASARITEHLGASRAADAQRVRVWRRNRKDPQACLAMARLLLERRGPYEAWRWMNGVEISDDTAMDIQAEWHSCYAYVCAVLRDFDSARVAFSIAHRLSPANPWIWVEWAYVNELQDSYGKAISSAKKALRIFPGYRPAIQALAHLYSLVGRDSDGLALLVNASRNMESANLLLQLIGMHIEHGQYEQARSLLNQCEVLSPLAGKRFQSWLASQRADIALRLDDLPMAKEYAALAGGPFYSSLLERLLQNVPNKRVMLNVEFVRQHHMTCAPATLTALSRFWGKPAEHLDIAEKICYDGTSAYSERTWAESQGFIAREFTLDWKSACQLIDAGIPFTLATVGVAVGHLQAVIGYDSLRQTLLVRDPFQRIHAEFDIAALLSTHESTGPRAMVLVPEQQAHRLAQITLPEAEFRDGYFKVMRALTLHDRAAAVAEAEAMSVEKPEDRLTIWALRAILAYDRDDPALLAQTERLLALHPNDPNLLLSKAGLLAVCASRSAQLSFFTTALDKNPRNSQLLGRHARLLLADFKQLNIASRQVHLGLRYAPTDALCWNTLADLLWLQGKKDDALAHYRIAACLDPTNEQSAESYFRAAHFTGARDAAMAFLQRRFERLGHKAAWPAITLAKQLELTERTAESFACLQAALRRRPGDGDLLLTLADRRLFYGQLEDATKALAAVSGSVRLSAMLRLKALAERRAGHTENALSLARQACEMEPLNLELQRIVAGMLAQLHGRNEAVSYLRAQCVRFPYFVQLSEMLVAWLGDDDLAASEAILQRILELNGANVWAQRELAVNLTRQGNLSAAEDAAQRAMQIAPEEASTHAVLGYVLARQKRTAEAVLQFRHALALSIDNEYALNALMGTCVTLEERRAALTFVNIEMTRQVMQGDILLSYPSAARNTYSPEELFDVLNNVLQLRPDLWQAWVAVCMQYIELDCLDQASDLMAKAAERYPTVPAVYLEQARVHFLRHEYEAARLSLRPALQINPAWHPAVHLYVDSVLEQGQGYEDALALLDSPMAHSPDDAQMPGLRAKLLWNMGERAQAMQLIEHALNLDPSVSWLWPLLRGYAEEIKDGECVLRVARMVAEQRPGDCLAWIRLSEYLPDPAEALDAIARALQLEPGNAGAYEIRLGILLKLRRDDDVAAMLASTPWGHHTPLDIRRFGPRLLWWQGKRAEAVHEMRVLLEEDPNHFGLWQELADWYDASDLHVQYVEASANLLRIRPHFYLSHNYAGHAAQKDGRKEDARRHYAEAMRLDPKNGFAGYSLADLLLAEKQLDDAAQVLHALERHVRGPFTAARLVQLAALQRDPEAARLPLKQALQASGQDQGASEMAMKAVRRANWGAMLDDMISACIKEGACTLHAARYWLGEQAAVKDRAFFDKMKPSLDRDPSHVLKRAVLAELAEVKALPVLDHLVTEYRDDLVRNDECWAEVGYAYLCYDRFPDVVKWMADWEFRKSASNWSLDLLDVALRSTGKYAEARKVTLASLERLPGNQAALTWLAFDAALEDDFECLETRLTKIASAQLQPYYLRFVQVMHAYVTAIQSGSVKEMLVLWTAFKDVRKVQPPLDYLMSTLRKRAVWKHAKGAKRYWRWLQFASK